jgi:hypothetical protein
MHGNIKLIDIFSQLVVEVDKRMLTYSPQQRIWIFDIDEINEEDITPNVLDLLGTKMASGNAQVSISNNNA